MAVLVGKNLHLIRPKIVHKCCDICLCVAASLLHMMKFIVFEHYPHARATDPALLRFCRSLHQRAKTQRKQNVH